VAQEQFEKTPKRANRWFRAFVVFSLLYGVSFSLNGFFNWIFFCTAVYSLFMSYFLLPVQPKVFQARQSRDPRGTYSNPATAPVSTEDKAKKVVRIIVISVFGVFFLFFFISIFSGNSDDDSTTLPNDPPAEEDLASSPATFTSRGNEFFNEQQYDSADWYYDRALASDGSYGEAIYGKGIVQYNKGNPDVANSYFTRAYEGGFRFAWLSWVLGDTYEKKGEPTRAIELYKESVNLDSTYVDSYNRLAELVPDERDRYLDLAKRHATN
jgi:tetratricopeptide (TPR) repeat protein